MAVLRYLSHPQVVIDPDVPVPDWPLSDQGRQRVSALQGANWLTPCSAIISSTERKARETAQVIGAFLGIEPTTDPALNEIDRSSTGYLPHDRHETVADAFFADPDSSIEGWEPASKVRARGLAAIRDHASRHRGGDLLIVGHGGIGTLCWCALAGLESRDRPDQPAGGGAVWSVRLPDLAPLHGWLPMELVATEPSH